MRYERRREMKKLHPAEVVSEPECDSKAARESDEGILMRPK